MNMDVGKYQLAEILGGFTDKILRKGGTKNASSQIEELIE